MTLDVFSVSGDAVTPWLDDLAALRIRVFRDYPYLYDGQQDYERRYLAAYAASTASTFVLAVDQQRVVGAATALPLVDADQAFHQPFLNEAIGLDTVFYFGESVLLPAYRGRGVGHRFFDLREQAAHRFGAVVTAFCAVSRASDHPARPPDYRPLNTFWEARGYRPMAGMTAHYPWRDIGESAESVKAMQFWLRTTVAQKSGEGLSATR